MLHLFLSEKPWFEARGSRFCARPVRREAHLLIAIFLLALIGVNVAMMRGAIPVTAGIVAIVLGTSAFMAIAMRRTARCGTIGPR